MANTDQPARMQRVHQALDLVGADRSAVEVRIDETAGASARPSHGVISVGRAADGPDDELHGIVAHEYAHIIDPHLRRDLILRTLPVLAAFATMAAVLATARPTTMSWQPLAIVGIMITMAAMVAPVSRRAEYRADATAAKLLGGIGPVVAMLERIVADDRTRGRRPSMRPLTHPAPKRRIRCLRAATQ